MGRDLSEIANGFTPASLEGSLVATQCPVRAELDHSSLASPSRLELSEVEQARFDAAEEFRQTVIEVIIASGAHVTVVDGHETDRRADTSRAMEGGAEVVIGGALPDDPVGRRQGGPDILVRTLVTTPGREPVTGWVPVIVKRHALTRDQTPGSIARRSSLQRLDPADAEVVDRIRFRSNLDRDARQLAHHWRLLEAAGLVAPDQPPVGGVIDRTATLWWVDLDEARWQPTWARGLVSTLERYDRAFEHRLRVIDDQIAREQGRHRPSRVTPVSIGECRRCPWNRVCHERMEAEDHVSLLPYTTFDHVLEHGQRGIRTRADVASLHLPTAQAIFGSEANKTVIDPNRVRRAGAVLAPDTPISAVVGNNQVARQRLHTAGIRTVADLNRLDPVTLAYANAPVGHLPTTIDQARAAVSGRVHRTRGTERIDVVRADVEVDVDMENVEAGVYLWGTLTTVRTAVGLDITGGYRPFLSWEPMSARTSAAVFVAFWTWFDDLRQRCSSAGASFAAYCYTNVEHTKMHQIAVNDPGTLAMPSVESVDEMASSPEWVDLHAVVKRSIITGHGLGLKKVAPLAGFGWRDDDPGGEQSMIWHDRAVTDPDPLVRQAHRERLLAYNEDDVRATLAVREWLEHAELPAIEDWTAR